MNEQPTQQSTNRWKWFSIGLLFLLVLMVTCLISAVWGGVIGYALGRRDGYPSADYNGYDAPYEAPSPSRPMPNLPDMPELSPLEGGPWLGVSFVMGEEGAQVTNVVPGSPAEDAGLEIADIITAVDGMSVTATHPLDVLILGYMPGDRVELTIARGGREQTIRVRLGTRMSGDMPWLPDSFPTEPPLIPDWHG